MLRHEGRSPAFRELDRMVRSAIRRDSWADVEERLRVKGSSSLLLSALASRLTLPVSGCRPMSRASCSGLESAVFGSLAELRKEVLSTKRSGACGLDGVSQYSYLTTMF